MRLRLCCVFLRLCRCLSPPGVGAGITIVVSVNRLSAPAPLLWSYHVPVIQAVTPGTINPNGGTVVTIYGFNFGPTAATGSVTIGRRACVPSAMWNDTIIECSAPVGVATSAAVVVTTSGQASVTTTTTPRLHYDTPHVASSSPSNSSTTGGGNLTLSGSAFAAGALRATVTLARRGAGAPQHACPVIASNSTVIVCAFPEGAGVGWFVVVTNVDDDGASTQSSPWSAAAVTYNPPTIASVNVLSTGAPAIGGFTVAVNGSNFSNLPAVWVGSQACTLLAVNTTHRRTVCVAPPHRLDEPAVVSVVVDGQTAVGPELRYDGPTVVTVSPTSLSAQSSDVRPDLTVSGVNFGVRSIGADTVPANHTVLLDAVPCSAVRWVSDSMLTCSPVGDFAVGVYDVVVEVYGQRSREDGNVTVAFDCPAGSFGAAGEHCQRCPDGSTCAGGGAEPAAQAGYDPLARASFVLCSPPEACLGGATAECSALYTGPRCASCAPGAYRCVTRYRRIGVISAVVVVVVRGGGG